MNDRELMRMAEADIKNNRKQNQNTVASASFSMTILIIVLFLGWAFYGGLRSSVRKYKVASSYMVTCSDETDLSSVKSIFNKEDVEEEMDYASTALLYHFYRNETDSSLVFDYPVITIDGVEYSNKGKYSKDIFNACPSDVFLENEEEYMKKAFDSSPIVLWRGYLKSDREMIVSSSLLDGLGVSYEEAIGKSISYHAVQSLKKNSDEVANLSVFEDFIIAGVFDERLYASPSRGESDYEMPSFIIKNFESLHLPEYQETYNHSIIQFKDFKRCYLYLNPLRYQYDSMIEKQKYMIYYVSAVISDYDNYRSVFGFLIQFFSIVGVVVLFAAVINLYLTVSYSYFRKRRYLGIEKAVGMKNKDVMKLFLFENLLALKKVAIISTSLSFVLCLVSCLALNATIFRSMSFGTVNLKLNFMYYFPVVLAYTAFIVLVSVLISWLVCVRDMKKPVSELLKQ